MKRFIAFFVVFIAMFLVTGCGEQKGTKGLAFEMLSNNSYSVSLGNAGDYKEIVIPSRYIGRSVTRINSYAFAGDTSLTNITIPDSVNEIGESAFAWCTSLTSIKFNGSVKQWETIEKDAGWNNEIPASKIVCSDGNVNIK